MSIQLPSHDFQTWRESARKALSMGVTPDRFDWQLPDLCVGDAELAVPSAMVPGTFLNLARVVAMHNSEERWVLLYSLLWRLHHGEPEVLSLESDPQVARAWFLAKAVERDMLKMKAFVKFQVRHDLKVAWYKTDHHITEEMAPYFVKRDPANIWMLHTPDLTVRWNLKDIELSAGLQQPPRFLVDDHEDVWLRYYRAQFDPARQRVRLAGGDFVRHQGTEQLTQLPKTEAHPPASKAISRLREAAKGCLVCPFARKSTQTVFGEGPKRAAIMFVGEQPGDQEDKKGHPFVGPAGAMLDEILSELGIPRDEVYVTNAVKHFKFETRGKRRIHMKPNGREISACRPWLEKEIEAVRPAVIVALGATAAQSLSGRVVKVTRERGQWLDSEIAMDAKVLATWHPSAILRSIDALSRLEKRAELKADLKRAWSEIRHRRSMRPVPDSHAHPR